MGANSTEYGNQFRNKSADDLRRNTDESRFGKAYQNKLGKLALPGMMAPMAGMLGSSQLTGMANAAGTSTVDATDYMNYADMAMGAGSALGAVAAPLMFRSATKQNASNAADMNTRSNNLRSGNRMTGSQRADTVLNAGSAVQKAGMGAVGAGYAANAMTGGAALSGQQIMAITKLGSIATPAGAAVTSGLGFKNAMSPFSKDAAGNAGSIDYSELGLGGGSAAGMAMMVAMMMGGNKLTKGIKGFANKDKGQKYKYKSSALSAGNVDRDLQKYNVLGTAFNAQISMLAMTDKLSPFENLALTALTAIASNTGAGPALFNFLTGKEDAGNRNLKMAHNKLSNELGQEDEFSSISGHKKAGKQGKIEKIIEKYGAMMSVLDKTILDVSKGVQAGATALNPLSILFGGIFGPSAEKQISGMYGLDEDSIRENAVEKVASKLNLPVSMIAIAETRADKILQMAGDDPDSKKIAALQLIAEINRNQLLLMLEEHKKSDGGVIGKTQEQFEIMDSGSGVQGALKSFRGMVGNIPGLGLIASLLAMKEASDKKGEYAERELESNLDWSQGSTKSGISDEALANSFLGTGFPTLFLDSLDLDTERNLLLTELRDEMIRAWDGPTNKRGSRQGSSRSWDMVTGSIMSNQDELESRKGILASSTSDINNHYDELLGTNPDDKKAINKRRKQELVLANKKYDPDNEMSLQDNQDAEKEQKRKDLLNKNLSELIDALKGKVSGSRAPGTKVNAEGKVESMFGGIGGAIVGGIWSAGKATLNALLSIFQWSFQNKKKTLLIGAGLAYLGYRIYNSPIFSKELKDGVMSAVDFIGGTGKLLGATTGVLATISMVKLAYKHKKTIIDFFWTAYSKVKGKAIKMGLGILGIGLMGAALYAGMNTNGTAMDLIKSLPVVGGIVKQFEGTDSEEDQKKRDKALFGSALESLGIALMIKLPGYAKLAGLAIAGVGWYLNGGFDNLKQMAKQAKIKLMSALGIEPNSAIGKMLGGSVGEQPTIAFKSEYSDNTSLNSISDKGTKDRLITAMKKVDADGSGSVSKAELKSAVGEAYQKALAEAQKQAMTDLATAAKTGDRAEMQELAKNLENIGRSMQGAAAVMAQTSGREEIKIISTFKKDAVRFKDKL